MGLLSVDYSPWSGRHHCCTAIDNGERSTVISPAIKIFCVFAPPCLTPKYLQFVLTAYLCVPWNSHNKSFPYTALGISVREANGVFCEVFIESSRVIHINLSSKAAAHTAYFYSNRNTILTLDESVDKAYL
jgi:hypothetical protein